MTGPIRVEPHLPHPALPQADWADRNELAVARTDLSAEAAARAALLHPPFWFMPLIKIRNAVVGLFGLKSSAVHSPDQTEMIGIFPIVSRSPSEIVLGFDDRHLDFRLVVSVRPSAAGGRVAGVMTLVHRKILLGKIYIAVITPFHRLVVASMLASLRSRLAKVS